MAVLDTTFLIDLQLERPPALALLDRLVEAHSAPRVPAAAWVEFLAALGPRERARAVRVLEQEVQFESFTRELADEAARLQHELLREGRGMQWHDLQVAVTALHYNEALVTTDRAFRRVPGLEILGHG